MSAQDMAPSAAEKHAVAVVRTGLSDSDQAKLVIALRRGASWREAVEKHEAAFGPVDPAVLRGWRAELERRAAAPETHRMPEPTPPKPKEPLVVHMTMEQLRAEVLRLRALVAETRR